MHTALLAASQPPTGFSWINLVILLALVAIGFPLLQKIRKKARASRRARWARDDAEREAARRRLPEPSDPTRLPRDPED